MEGINNLEKMANALEHHVGSGGMAHLPASEMTNGFATKEMVINSKMGAGYRIGKPHGTDVLQLEPGRYEISNALNNPIGPDDKSYIEYDISEDTTNGGRRQIWAMVSVSGDVFYRDLHTGGDPDTGTQNWRQVDFTTKIWSGNVNKGKITFDYPVTYYHRGIEVYFTTISNQHCSARLLHGDSTTINTINHPDDGEKILQSYELAFTFAKDAITITHNNMVFATSNSIQRIATAGINITDIYMGV